MRNWQMAHEKMVRWEADGKMSEESKKSIESAWLDYFVTAHSRNLSSETIRKYKLLRNQMIAFAQHHGLRFLDQFD
jgi:hypothetical protein